MLGAAADALGGAYNAVRPEVQSAALPVKVGVYIRGLVGSWIASVCLWVCGGWVVSVGCVCVLLCVRCTCQKKELLWRHWSDSVMLWCCVCCDWVGCFFSMYAC